MIDFWATWCSSCIKSMPKLDSIQKKFSEDMIVLQVTSESKETVKRFLNKSKFLKGINLPSITSDTVLRRYFVYSILPHMVIIDKNGVVSGITTAEEITLAKIENYLATNTLKTKVKTDITDADSYKPFLIGGLGKTYQLDRQMLVHSSILTRFVDNLGSTETTSPLFSDGSVKLISKNASVAGLFCMAFTAKLKPYVRENNPDFYLRMQSRTIWEAKDSTLHYWIGRNREEWRKIPVEQKYFTYEIILPQKDSVKIFDYTIKELNRIFGDMYGIEGVREKRKVKCLALVRTDEKDRLRSKGGNQEVNLGPDKDFMSLKNATIDFMLWGLLTYYMSRYPMPIVNETGYVDPIDVEIHADLSDPIAVGKALNKYGLDFALVERELDMIIIRDKK